MKRALLLILLFVPTAALATGPNTAPIPTESELAVDVSSMRMPRLERRLKARAAAYRLFARTIKQLGFGEELVQQPTLHAKQYALLKASR